MTQFAKTPARTAIAGLVLVVLLLAFASVRPAAPPGRHEGVLGGARYRVDVPPGWNAGGLVLFAHGYQGDGDGSDVIAEVTGTAALGALRAVREGRLLAQLFNLTEPATPLVVDGAERIGDWLDGGAS